jgi:hypothetical protein
MRIIIVIASILCFLFTATIELVCLVSTKMRPSPQVERLHLTECHLPCWAGIAVGKTRFNDAKQRLLELFPPPDIDINEAPGSFTVSPDTIVNQAGYPAIFVSVQSENDIVNQIWIDVDSDYAPLLGDTIALYGTPQCRESGIIVAGRDTLIYEFPTFNIELGVEDRHQETPVTDILIESNDQRKYCTFLGANRFSLSWP